MSLKTALALSALLENNSLCYRNVHKTWGVITLKAQESTPNPNTPLKADFVAVIDICQSAHSQSKLQFLQASIKHLLSALGESQTFSLVAFHYTAFTLFEFELCTPANKTKILSAVNSLHLSRAEPSNLSQALAQGANILEKRAEGLRSRISTLMLFTDDLSNPALCSPEPLDTPLPNGCVFNTFGFGHDHNSKLLHSIALRAQGVYYYLEDEKDIPSTLQECVTGFLATRAHQIEVRLSAQDGARIVTLATPFKISENLVAKDYSVKLELLSSGEQKSILFRLSLRAMNQPKIPHHLLLADVSYINTLTGTPESLVIGVTVLRNVNEQTFTDPMPLVLDQHINRYSAATAITEAVEFSKKHEFALACAKLQETIRQIGNSASAKEPYCQDLIQDLQECTHGMRNASTFQKGIHYAHSCSSMYFMERSTGLARRLPNTQLRHSGYGYTTLDSSGSSCVQQSAQL